MEPYNSATKFIDLGYATGPVSWDNWEQEIEQPYYDHPEVSLCRNLFGAVGNCLRVINDDLYSGFYYREDGALMVICAVCTYDLEKGVGGRYFRKSDGRIVTRIADA